MSLALVVDSQPRQGSIPRFVLPLHNVGIEDPVDQHAGTATSPVFRDGIDDVPFHDQVYDFRPCGRGLAQEHRRRVRAHIQNMQIQRVHCRIRAPVACGNRMTNVIKMVEQSNDTQVRAQIMAMIERCPSGTFTFALEPDGEVVEPDLPIGIAVIPDGPLWVSGGIPVERRDGQPLETRNRVTLCRCGASKNKPLCDGMHKEVGFSDQN